MDQIHARQRPKGNRFAFSKKVFPSLASAGAVKVFDTGRGEVVCKALPGLQIRAMKQ